MASPSLGSSREGTPVQTATCSSARGAAGDVQLGGVGEVRVDEGLALACPGGDPLHAAPGAVLAARRERGVDELGPPLGPVRVPPRVAVIAGLFGRLRLAALAACG